MRWRMAAACDPGGFPPSRRHRRGSAQSPAGSGRVGCGSTADPIPLRSVLSDVSRETFVLASRTLRSRRFGTGSSNRKSRQQQIGRPVQVFRLRGISHHSRPGVLFSTLRNAQSLLPDADVKRLVRKPVLANGLPRSRKTCRTSPKTSAGETFAAA